MRPVRRALALALMAAPGAALAHAPEDLPAQSARWSFEPWILAPLLLNLGLFAIGWRRLSARSVGGVPQLRRRGVLFTAGWLVLAGAVVSPLHDAGARSFTAHMVEHELMMLVAAPLLVLSRPLTVMLWAFPHRARRRIGEWTRSGWVGVPWRLLSDPVTATLLQAAALWLWHAPALFDRALVSEGWHIAQHLSFVATALFFWSAMLHRRARQHLYGLAVICLFATSVVSGALGAFMAFSESPWYARYAALGLTPSGLTPAEDQQMAGLLMWIPGGMVHAAAALALIGRALAGPPVGAERHA